METQVIEKKGKLFSEDKILAFFSRIIEHEKHQDSTHKGPQVNLTNTVEVRRSFLLHLRGCWKQKNLKKKAIFPV